MTELNCPKHNENYYIDKMFLKEHRPDFFAHSRSVESSEREHSAVNGHNYIDREGVSEYHVSGAVNLRTLILNRGRRVLIQACFAVVCIKTSLCYQVKDHYQGSDN